MGNTHKGLPDYIFKDLPKNLIENLENIEYTPSILLAKIYEYFKNDSVHDLAIKMTEKKIDDFNKRYDLSTDKIKFIEKELINEDLDSELNLEDHAKYYKDQIKSGFDFAVLGRKPTINQYFENQFEVNKKDTYSSDDYRYIEETLQDLKSYIRGYSIAQYVGFIKEKFLYANNNSTATILNENVNINPQVKLKWLGTPAQFGFIIQELIGKGYLARPTSSYAKDAKIYFALFDIKTTDGTLQKELSDKSNSISSENARLLSITDINKLNNNNQKVAGK